MALGALCGFGKWRWADGTKVVLGTNRFKMLYSSYYQKLVIGLEGWPVGEHERLLPGLCCLAIPGSLEADCGGRKLGLNLHAFQSSPVGLICAPFLEEGNSDTYSSMVEFIHLAPVD